ncbi:hypothetical protein PFISCL1PPCAC_25033, partial [Pristionchus fissidentatus]
FAPITFSPSADGCDLTVVCQGNAPLDISIYYSSTADGASPIYTPENIGTLASDWMNNIVNFQFMRCVNNDWIPYMPDSGYQLENDPSGDPSSWFAYNNIFCTGRLNSSTVIPSTPTSPTTPAITTTAQTTIKTVPTPSQTCNCQVGSMQVNKGTPPSNYTVTSSEHKLILDI